MPHGGRSIQEEMSRFEAEINAARAQQFLMSGVAVTTAAPQISAPPTGAVISAPPSRPVVKDDEDVLATLQKYEKQVKEDTRCVVWSLERLAISTIQKK